MFGFSFGFNSNEDAPFDLKTWENIAARADDFVASTGNLLTAAHIYVCEWRKRRNPTTLKEEGLKHFEGVVNKDLFQYALDIATRGVIPKGDRRPKRFAQEPYSSITDNLESTASSLWEDVVKGRMFVVTVASEAYLGELMESKLAAVVQRDVSNPSKDKVRYISDPRLEVNERMCKYRHPKCVIPRHANVARRILFWQRRYPGVPVLIAKRDVKGAFKLIPVSIRGLWHMGCRVANFVCVYLALFFGWRPSPANWGIMASLLMQFVAAHSPANIWSEGPEAYVAYQYVDDGAFIEPWLGLRPWQVISLWEFGLIRCLGPGALNTTKRDVEGRAETRNSLWGIIVCTETNTFTLPADKIDKAKEFLSSPDFDPGCNSNTGARSARTQR